MFHKFIYYLKIQLEIQNFFHLGPYQWPIENGYPSLLKSDMRQYLYKANLFGHFLYVILMTLNFLSTLGANTTSSKMLGSVFLDCFIAVVGIRIVFLLKDDEGLILIKHFMKFENGYAIAQKQKSSDVIMEACMIVGILTCVLLPIFMMSILYVEPCKPPHLGYIILMTATGCQTPPWPLRICLLLFDAYMWLSVASTAVYYNTNFFLLGAKCMEYYLEQGRCHYFVKTQPWERYDCRGMTFEERKSHAFHIYRQVQILNRLYNEILKTIFIPSIVGGSIVAIIISLYASFKLHRDIPMPGLAFFPLLAVDGLCGIVSVKMAAGVLDQSEKFLAAAKNIERLGWHKLYKKEIVSLDKIKVSFGSSNFINKMTPFVFLDFCFANTANLMLLT